METKQQVGEGCKMIKRSSWHGQASDWRSSLRPSGYGFVGKAWYGLGLKGTRRRQKLHLGHAKRGSSMMQRRNGETSGHGPCSSGMGWVVLVVGKRHAGSTRLDAQQRLLVCLSPVRYCSVLYLLPPCFWFLASRRPHSTAPPLCDLGKYISHMG